MYLAMQWHHISAYIWNSVEIKYDIIEKRHLKHLEKSRKTPTIASEMSCSKDWYAFTN